MFIWTKNIASEYRRKMHHSSHKRMISKRNMHFSTGHRPPSMIYRYYIYTQRNYFEAAEELRTSFMFIFIPFSCGSPVHGCDLAVRV